MSQIKIECHDSHLNGKLQTRVEFRDGKAALVHCDRVNLDSAVSRQRVVKAVLEKLGITKGRARRGAELEQLLLQKADEIRQQRESEKSDGSDNGADATELLDAMPIGVVEEARAMLVNPRLMSLIVSEIEIIGVAGERQNTATTYLAGVSRLLDRPVSVITQGPTATGKSLTQERVADLFPPESIIRATQMTPQALFYMKPGSLRHRIIAAGERSRREDDDAAEATRALREMISRGKLSKLIPIKDASGQITTKLIEQDGPISFWESTTLSRIFDEDRNRCILLVTDEREEQTRRILRKLAAKQSAPRFDPSPILARHHALQRLLAMEPALVVIPFADRMAEAFPCERSEARRAFAHVMTMIEACALLHHQQRQHNSDSAIIASAEDYKIARYLLADPMSRSLGRAVSPAAKRLAERLDGWFGGVAFESPDVYRKEAASDRAVRGWLSELCVAGFLKLLDATRGRATRWQISENPPDLETATPLPTVDVICTDSNSAAKMSSKILSSKELSENHRPVDPEQPEAAGKDNRFQLPALSDKDLSEVERRNGETHSHHTMSANDPISADGPSLEDLAFEQAEREAIQEDA